AGPARPARRARAGAGGGRARGRARGARRGGARRPAPGGGAARGAAGPPGTPRSGTETLAARGARTRTGALTESPPSTVASTTSWRRVPMPANEPRKTKADRREAARREAERLAAKQKATESRNRIVIAVVSVVVVALVVVAGVLRWRESQRTLLTGFEGARPAGSPDTGGITFGSDLEAGSTNEGAPEVDVYVDFMCPACGQYDAVNRED